MKLAIDSCIKRLSVPAIGHRIGADHTGRTLEMSKEHLDLHCSVPVDSKVGICLYNTSTSQEKYSTRFSDFTSLTSCDVNTSVSSGYSSKTESVKRNSKKFQSKVDNRSSNWSLAQKSSQKGILLPSRECYISVSNNDKRSQDVPSVVISGNPGDVDRGFQCQSQESFSSFLNLPKASKKNSYIKTRFANKAKSVDIGYMKSRGQYNHIDDNQFVRQSDIQIPNSHHLCYSLNSCKPIDYSNNTELQYDPLLFSSLSDKPLLTATDNIYRTNAHARSPTIQHTSPLNDASNVTYTLTEAPQVELIDKDRCGSCPQPNHKPSIAILTRLNPCTKQRRDITSARSPVQFSASLTTNQDDNAEIANSNKLNQNCAHPKHLSHKAHMSRNVCPISCCADDASFKSAFSDSCAAEEKTMKDACLSDRPDLGNVTLEVIVDSLRQMEEQTNHVQTNKWPSDVTVNAEYKIHSEYSLHGNDENNTGMERARPSRSGIPTFVGANGGRVQCQGPDKEDAGTCPSAGRVTTLTPQSRRDRPPGISRNVSPRPPRSGHHSISGYVDSMDTQNVAPQQSASVLNHYYTPKQGQSISRPYMTQAYVKQNNMCSGFQRESQETNTESELPPSHTLKTQLQATTQLPSDERDRCDKLSVPQEQNVTCHGGPNPGENNFLHNCTCHPVEHHPHLTHEIILDTPVPVCARDGNRVVVPDSKTSVSEGNPLINTSSPHSTLANANGNLSSACDESTTNVNKQTSFSSDIRNTTPEEALLDMDYPIRGTISPLTNKMAVKRCLGTVDEVSFVFGRPVSPTNDHVIRCNPPQSFTNPGIARCLSASPARYIPGHCPQRPMSPSSDVLPVRRGIILGARRVLSPPPVLGVGAAAEPRIHSQGGICCEHCNGCLVELKRQALRLMFPDNDSGSHLAQSICIDNIGDKLSIPEGYERWYSRAGNCGVCETPISHLKQETVVMIQSIQLAQTTASSTSIPALVGSCGHLSQPGNRYNARQIKHPTSYASSVSLPTSTSSVPIAAQAQAYLDQNVRAYISPRKYSQILASRHPGVANQQSEQEPQYDTLSSSGSSSCRLPTGHYHHQQLHDHHWTGYAHQGTPTTTCHHVPSRGGSSTSPVSSPTSPPPVHSVAVSFFARAAQKLGKKKKRHHSQDQEPLPSFPTNFADVIRLTPPPAPPCLLRTVGRLQNPGMGKVKVMLKICSPTGSQGDQGASFLSSDPRKKQVTVFDPSASGYVTSANRKAGAAVPKMFAFDSVFTPDDSLTELCASSLAEIVQAVVAGADGCLFTYGYSKLGKTYTMIGSDQSSSTLGVMPCAIAWLFKLINEQKDKTGARFSVRVSAVQVTGKEETLRDLLTEIAQGTEATGVGTAPSVYLREDPICGTQLENQSELRAPTADKAAFYLDAALASRSSADEDDSRSSHMLFTLNVYQYRIEKSNTKAGLPGVAGGRSRLHLIDLGTASKSKDPNNVSLSLSALGNVIMALLNGQRHVPHRDSKIAQLLRDSLGNLSCRTCMIAHVSSAVAHYNETLQVIQLAARIHRMKRRRTKFSSTSSEDSSTDGDVKFRRPYRGLRMGTLREDILYSSSHSDPDYTSSSEQSCDTVIYIGANGQSLSDRELTDNEGPPRHVPRTNPRLPRRPSGSRSSGDDSDSGRSMHSVRSLESRLPIRALMSPPPVAAVAAVKMTQPQAMHSMPGSPNPGLVKMGHRMGLGSKISGVTEGRAAAGDGASASGHWQERPAKIHCHSSQSKLAKAIHEKQQPLEGEQWIDGPGVAIYPEPKNSEMWVDGPPAFIVQQQPHSALLSTSDEHHHQHYRADSSSKRLATKKVDAQEQWVDGPKEMLTGSSLSQPMHTCSKAEYTSKTSHQSISMSSGVNEKTLKQALVKHILETKDSPESSMSIDSTSSLHVEAADSSSVNFNSSDDQSRSSCLSKMKSAGSNSASCDNKQVDASSSPMVSTRASKLSESPRKIHSSTQSPLPSPGPSPSVSRKNSKIEASHMSRLQKSQLPGSASPTHRVVQWIKSVSSKQESTGSASNTSRLDRSGQCPAQVTTPSENVTMADAETNTEHDSDFERMAEENGFKSDSEEDMETHKSSKNVKCETYDSDDIKCNIAIDTSLDSSFDTSVAIQESIYEHEVEERLELLKTKDGTQLASEVDNETFSNMSCSYKDSDELDHDSNNPETDSLLVQHTKILTESKQAAQIAHHIASNCRQTNVLSSSSNVYDTSRPMLSRKPDGASNPNLLKVFLEEDSFNKTQFNCQPGTSLEAMFISASHESGMEYPSTSSKSCVSGNVDEDTVCDNDVNVQSVCSKGDGSSSGYVSSPKLGTKSKPPLPTKLSPVLKPSGLPKSTANSQSSVNYSPSRSIYCTAKPTHSGKDPPGVQQKTSPSGKLSGIPLSNITSRNKLVRSDKTASSSLTSHSPQSSAASSPHISSTSKSSSSSPAQKAGPKSHNGSTNKSYCSKSLSTLTKDNGKLRKKEKEKEKDIKEGSTNRTTKLSDLVSKGKGNDSDSGNDSGIVALERRLLSPYATITKPRTPSHSSSGHGSDNSTVSTEVHSGNSRPCTKAENLHGGTSSGYESMLRDSEATGSSSGPEDSGSEASECQTGSKRKGTRRSHSAPSRSTESSPVSSQPSQAGTRSAVSTHRAWVDTRHLHKVKDEPLELKRYDPDEVERLGRRRTDDEVKIPSDIRVKNGSSKSKEEGDEISDSKDRIMMERNGWSFDCKFLMCFSCKSGQRGTDV